MTVLVTGAAGLLGSHIVDLLVEGGERPRALVRPGERVDHLPPEIDLRTIDIRDAEALGPALDGVTWVLHCAAKTGPWGPLGDYEATNVRALEMLVRFAAQAGVQRIVHVSSVTVHGNDVRGAADESSPLRVEPNPYSRTKVSGERLLERLIESDGAPVTIVRPGWIYGPRDVASFGRFATMIRDGRMVMIGSGTNQVPLIYVGDAARGVLQAAAADGAVGRSYLLVNDEPVTQRAYLGAIALALGVPAPTRRMPYRLALGMGAAAEMAYRATRRPGPPPVMRYGIQLLGGDNRFNVDRARREIGFAPEIGMTEGVRRSVEWYRDTDEQTARSA